MIRLEEGKRFTDDAYARKEEVRALYNVEDISSVWNQILSYRSFYNQETELRDKEGNPYQVCLTKKLLSSAYKLQMDLRNDKFRYRNSSSEIQNAFLFFRKKSSLSRVAKKNGIIRTNSTLERVTEGKRESLSSSLFLRQAYSEAFGNGSATDYFSLDSLYRINRSLLGLEDSQNEILRTKPSDSIYNTLNDFPVAAIPKELENLNRFLKQDAIPVIIRALGILYFRFSVRPFEYFNEETAALAAKAFLSSSGFGLVGYLLDFESIAFSKDFSRRKACEESLDLTYFISPALSFLASNREAEHTLLLKEISDAKEKEPQSNEGKNSGSEGEALPFFPTLPNPDKINETAINLRQIYPYLKKKQAHFYAGHCTIGLHYTIEQFKDEEGTVYETARTSMETLAARGFYKKEQIGKKFVYTPIPLDSQSKE